MKKIICFMAVLLFALNSYSQTPAPTKDYYLKKSKTQKTVGWIMLGGGVTMATIGFINYNNDPSGIINNSLIISLAGVGVALGSIPVFLSAGHFSRKAAAISFNNQKILYPQQNVFVLKSQPTLTLKINL